MSQRTSIIGSLLVAGMISGVFAGATRATAADLDAAYADIPPLQEQKVEFGSGWYIRGDLGGTRGLAVGSGSEPYSTAAINNSTYANAASYTQGVFTGPGDAVPSIASSSSSRLLYDATLGAGYQFNRWFRADATFDFHQPVKTSSLGATVPCVIGFSPVENAANVVTSENILATGCTPTQTASLKSYSALVNGYIDLGTWSRVTPYIGAGIGLSFGYASSSSTYHMGNQLPYAGVTFQDAVSPSVTYYQNFDRSSSTQYYNLAFALMGGIAIDVYDHTKLDIGYRYLHLGEVLGTSVNAQEVRAGLRYMIDN